MKIALIFGGKSGEHEISLVSAAAIARALNESHTIILIGITKNGKWFLQDDAQLQSVREGKTNSFSIIEKNENEIRLSLGSGMFSFATKTKSFQIDIVFPALHGTFGEDGTIQGLCELLDLPYVGCNVFSSALTMDKEKTKQLLAFLDIPIVPYVVIKRTDVFNSRAYDERIEKAIAELSFPLFVKPSSAGSSDGASKVNNRKELSLALLDAFNWDDKVLIEKCIDARELECAVLGNTVTFSDEHPVEKPRAFGPGEIILTHEFYDYNAKYKDSDSVAIPASLDDALAKKIRALALRAYEAVDASGMSRVDFFLDKKTNEIFVNEINSIPGFTSISMFPKLCEHAGLSFTELCETLLEEAVLRYKAKNALQTSR